MRFTNAGSLAHDLRVFRGDREVGGTPAFQGGSRTATLRLGPGDYRMVCTVGDHAQLGMRAVLRVRARN
jgi:plastocyanin